MQTFNLSFLASDDALVSSAFVIQGQDKKAVVVVPRDQLDVALSNSEFKNLPHKGVYVLLGEQRFYVGKTSQGLDSVKQLDGKDFWQVAVLCVADVFDREMMDGVEAETATYLLQHSGLKLENEQQPSYQYLSFENQNKVQTCLNQFMGALEFLARNPLAQTQTQMMAMTVADKQEEDGLNLQCQVAQLTRQLQEREQEVTRLQQELQKSQVNVTTTEECDAADSSVTTEDIPEMLRDVFIFQSNGLTARLSYRGEKQWVVLAGSQLRGEDRKDDRLFVQKIIAEAKENHTITEHSDGYLETSVDFSFSAPSAAMAFVYGSGVGAFDKWHNEAGVTLRTLLAQADESVETDAAENAAQPQTTLTDEIPEQLRGVLLFQARNLSAKMSYRGEKQWVVLAGSQLRGVDRKDTQVSTRKIIAEAKKRHELTEQADGSFVINRDFYCKTPSAALALVLGGEGTDALTHWHNEDVVTLRALLAQAKADAPVAADTAAQPQSTATEEIPEQLRGVFHLQSRSLKAWMSYRGVDQWVVLAGSQLLGGNRNYQSTEVQETFDEAKARQALKQVDGYFVTKEDFTFSGPSSALAFVMNSIINGPDFWSNEEGVTLRTLLAQSGLKSIR